MFKFNLKKPQNWQRVYAAMVAEGRKNGVSISGNSQRGSGSHRGFQGEFTVTGSQIQITVTEKPFFAPKSLIESHVRDYISKKTKEVA